MELTEDVRQIIKKIDEAGYEAYIVGGAVRDYLLGRDSSDIDIATSATPNEIKEIFTEVRDTGLEFGTVTILEGDECYEVTTYRTEGKYTDGRRPEDVAYVRSLEEDLSRRDLTINAMAYHPEKGIVDYFGGKEDLKAGVIRCVGQADTRFEEDYLRILRAIRFESQLDFKMVESTELAYKKNIEGLQGVSKERIRKEMEELFAGKGVERVIRERRDVVEQIYGGTIQRGLAVKIRGYKVGYLVELSRGMTLKETEDKMKELKYPTKDIRWVTLVKEFEKEVTEETTKVGIKKLMRAIRKDRYLEVLEYITLKGDNTEEHYKVVGDIERNNETTALHELSVNGTDLMGYGYKGKEIGDTLYTILNAVIEGKLKNKKEEIEKYIGKYKTV